MTAWLACATLRLYPLAFQRRYGEEMRALLEQAPPRPLAVVDLLRGALVAHLRPSAAAAGYVGPADRVRASTSGVLTCWVIFAAAGFAFYKSTEDHPFSAAADAHPLLGGAHVAVQVLAIAASAAVVAGSLPLIAAALDHLRRQDGGWRRLLGPVVPLLVFAGLTPWLVILAHAQPAPDTTRSTAAQVAFILWGLAGLGCGIACAVGCRSVLFATPVAVRRLQAALACATFVTVAMLVMAAATAMYAVALAVDASQLSASANGPLQAISTSASLIVQVIVMTLAGALAVVATRRAWRVTSELSRG
jgi:uncharacterized membrane protein